METRLHDLNFSLLLLIDVLWKATVNIQPRHVFIGRGLLALPCLKFFCRSKSALFVMIS